MTGKQPALNCRMHEQAIVSRSGSDEKPCGGLEVGGVKRREDREKRS